MTNVTPKVPGEEGVRERNTRAGRAASPGAKATKVAETATTTAPKNGEDHSAKYVEYVYGTGFFDFFASQADKPFEEKGVKRCLSRTMEDYGGSIGTPLWTLFIPLYSLYFYGIVVLPEVQGELLKANPLSPQLWYDFCYKLPEGISILPTWKATGFILGWILFQMLMEIFVPPYRTDLGVPLKTGTRLSYVMNGFRCFVLTHVSLAGAIYFDLLDSTFIWRNMGALLSSSILVSMAISLWVYIDFGIFWRRHAEDPEFEEDWGVFDLRMFFNDYFCGVVRNPRFLHRFVKNGFDFKRFSNARPGLTGWVVWNFSFLAATYFNCHLDSSVNAVCEETGDFTRIPLAGILIAVYHWYYIFDYNWNEPAYLTTTDIRHDLYGFALSFGCLSFVQFYYPTSYLNWVAWQRVPLLDNHAYVAVGVAMMTFGMILFRLSNIQKHNFRTFIADGGDLAKYKVWGKPVEYIKTKEGSYLLLSGFWGLARHFNYIGDMVMCVGWMVACMSPKNPFPWAPLSYVAYFWIMDVHRLYRDENRCAKKYKQDWVDYKKRVPYCIIPGVY